MNGWIIYTAEDVEKNKKFVEMLTAGLSLHNIDVKCIILEDAEREIREHQYQKGKTKIPDFVINRSRNAEIAYLLEKRGVRVFNSARVTEIANDKEHSYRFLEGCVPYMSLLEKESAYPYVIKSCNGHGGSQVFLVKNQLSEAQAIKKMQGQKFVRQKCCSDLGKDVRVYVIGNQIVAAVLRTSENDFRSNYSLGGNVRSYELSTEEREMVFSIIKKIPMDYAGIDFIFHKGKAIFNEIEDAVGARMLYACTELDIISIYADYIAKQLIHK